MGSDKKLPAFFTLVVVIIAFLFGLSPDICRGGEALYAVQPVTVDLQSVTWHTPEPYIPNHVVAFAAQMSGPVNLLVPSGDGWRVIGTAELPPQALTLIRSGEPIPDPDDQPDPGPNPGPQPVADRLVLTHVHESGDQTPEQNAVTAGASLHFNFETKTHYWRSLDVDQIDAPLSTVIQGVALPAIVVDNDLSSDNGVFAAVPLPETLEGVKALAERYTSKRFSEPQASGGDRRAPTDPLGSGSEQPPSNPSPSAGRWEYVPSEQLMRHSGTGDEIKSYRMTTDAGGTYPVFCSPGGGCHKPPKEYWGDFR